MSSAIADGVRIAQRFSAGSRAWKDGKSVKRTTERVKEPRTIVSGSENQLEFLTRSLLLAVLYLSPASRALVLLLTRDPALKRWAIFISSAFADDKAAS